MNIKSKSKKIISLLLVSAMMLSFAPIMSSDYADLFLKSDAATNTEYYTESYYTYTVDENTKVTIIRCDTTASGDIEVPSELRGYPVVAIGVGAFENCSALESIALPEGITSIEENAFSECTSLKTINIPSTVTDIGESAFYHCAALASDIKIPTGVTTVNDLTFSRCEKISSIIIPDTVTSIGGSAFSDCYSLKEIVIPDGITRIAPGTFLNCKSLTEINIPDSVVSIGKQAFSGCSSITEFRIPDSVTEIGYNVFEDSGFYNNESNWDNGILYLNEFLVDVKRNVSENKTIKEGTRYIVERAFESCQNLEGIIIPDSVVEIYDSTFKNCSELKNAEIGKGVTRIGKYAFTNCKKLKKITIPGNVKQIDDYAFSECVKLEKVTIEKGVQIIGTAAFSQCKSLADISINDSVTEIKTNVFIDCTSLEIIELPKNIKYIDAFLFHGCTSLKNVVIPDKVEKICGYAFYNCSSLKEITIPESVTYIGDYAFTYCQSLESIHIPSKVETIETLALSTGGNLKEITVDKNNPHFSSDEYGVLFNKDQTYLIQYPCGKTDEIYKVPHGAKRINDYAFISEFDVVENYKIVFSNVKKLYFPKSLEIIEDCYHPSFACNYVTDIYYEGTEEEYNQIDNVNKFFPNATVHPNSYDQITDTPEAPEIPVVPDEPQELESIDGRESPIKIYPESGAYDGEVFVDFKEIDLNKNEVDELEAEYARLSTNTGAKAVITYDIKVVRKDGDGKFIYADINEGKKVKVKIPVPDDYDKSKTYVILHKMSNVQNENNKLVNYIGKTTTEEINGKVYFVIDVEHFSNFTIMEVEKKPVSSIIIVSVPSKTSYTYKSGNLNLTGLLLTVTYSDGTTETVTDTSKMKITGFDNTKTGTQTVSAEYVGASASFDITVSYAWWQWIIRILLLGFLWY